jgi:hypothetical protein
MSGGGAQLHRGLDRYAPRLGGKMGVVEWMTINPLEVTIGVNEVLKYKI